MADNKVVINNIVVQEITKELYNQIKYGESEDEILFELVSSLTGKDLRRLVYSLELDHIELPYDEIQ
mgnify:FL=1